MTDVSDPAPDVDSSLASTLGAGPSTVFILVIIVMCLAAVIILLACCWSLSYQRIVMIKNRRISELKAESRHSYEQGEFGHNSQIFWPFFYSLHANTCDRAPFQKFRQIQHLFNALSVFFTFVTREVFQSFIYLLT